MQYSLDQYTLIAKRLSDINHRGDISILDSDGKGRVFVSPMTCLLNKDNFDTFLQSQFIPIYPIWNGENIESRLEMSITKQCWIAVSLREFENLYYSNVIEQDSHYKILIDCADGHLKKIFTLVRLVKEKYSNIEIMIGNIENPETYIDCCEAGVDYVRVGVGGGKGCLSSVKLGFHTSMGWLLTEIQKIKDKHISETFDTGELYYWENKDADVVLEGDRYSIEKPTKLKCLTKVIADGGISNSARMIKCLALGADYVMCGSLFAGTKEACGEERALTNEKIYYGQASKQGKIDRFGTCEGHIEGTETWVPVRWTLSSLSKELNDCFSSALSYGGAINWEEFIGKVQYDIQSSSEFRNYDKG